MTQNHAEAMRWIRKSAEQGHSRAQFLLGFDCATARNYTEAVQWFRKAAEQGDLDAQFHLGNCYAYGLGITKDPTEAVRWFRKAAEQGHEGAKKQLESRGY